MSEIGTRGGHSSDRADTDRAWEQISGLPARRGLMLPHANGALKLSDEPATTTPSASLSFRPEHPREPGALVAPDQLARDMAEIAQAAAALRREEPRLEPEFPGSEAKADLHTARSVWILVAVIWLSVASAVSCAIGAALLLFG